MVRYVFAFCVIFGMATLGAQTKEQSRLENCGVVMEEVLNIPDNIPQELLEKAECVLVIPSMTKVAIGFGGSYGRGAMVCRSGASFEGPWGAPAMYTLEGGSFGLQLGAESTDLVLLVMNRRGADALLSSKVKLGGNASAAAGPKGRAVEASTDASMRAEILSYSRSRGLFAGVSLSGTLLRPDNDANAEVYGHKITARRIVMGRPMTTVPESGHRFVNVLQRSSPGNESTKPYGQLRDPRGRHGFPRDASAERDTVDAVHDLPAGNPPGRNGAQDGARGRRLAGERAPPSHPRESK
ncbi:MAG TPA: lipid-binding SYLF domain-containing protein [Vicinamibacterales bacterium]|jgi:lipid-binding SYLF domain-containing protein